MMLSSVGAVSVLFCFFFLGGGEGGLCLAGEEAFVQVKILVSLPGFGDGMASKFVRA